MFQKIYIYTCALNRLTDDHSQPRIRREAEDMARILDLIVTSKLLWSASSILRFESERNPDPIRRLDGLKLLSNAAEIITPNLQSRQRARDLASIGLPYLDGLHLATAEQSEVEWLITTDDRFLKRSQARPEKNHPELINPVDWIQWRHLWLLPNPSAT